MAGYNEIRGLRVKYLSDDPAGAEDGQVWYNSTTGNLRVQGIGVGAWSSAAPLGTARYAATGFGVQTASVASMGVTIPNTPTTATEEYNGTGWSTGTNYPAGGLGGGTAGTQTAGLIAGGQSPRSSAANQYDGTSWTGTGALPVAADNISGCGTGTQTNVIMAIGRTPATGNSGTNTSVTYNGSVFGSGPNLNTARMYGSQAGSGTGTAGLIFGGFIDPSPNAMTNTEEYDGSSWTNGGSLNVATGFANGFGTQTNTVTNVKTPANQGSEQYNGTSWSALPNIGVATPGGNYLVATGTSGNAGMISAMSPTLNQVAEWNFTANTITPATWASGGTVPYTSRQNMSFGTQDAAINVGGFVTATLSTAASYDGASWTASPSLNVAARMGGVAGTQTAGLQFGGIQPPGTYNTNMQTWNGSAWANSPLNLTTGTYGLMGCGTQTAALKVGGENPAGGNYTTSEEFDGLGWTAGGTLPEAKYVAAGNGVQTSALITGGSPSGTTTFEYNGSLWTAGGALSTSRPGTQAGSAGVSSSSNIVFGGNAPGGVISATEGYDGTSWSTRPSLATGRGSTTGNGTSTAGLMVSGGPPSSTTTLTEEFTGETVSANIKTFTTS